MESILEEWNKNIEEVDDRGKTVAVIFDEG